VELLVGAEVNAEVVVLLELVGGAGSDNVTELVDVEALVAGGRA
jgi:hypothetical protein